MQSGSLNKAGILHRDVKPMNILRAGDRDFKLADFGIAQAAAVARTEVGTPGCSRKPKVVVVVVVVVVLVVVSVVE